MRQVFQVSITRYDIPLTPEPLLLASLMAARGIALEIAGVHLRSGARMTAERANDLLARADIIVAIKPLPLYGTSGEAHEASALQEAQEAFTYSGV